MSLCFGKSDHKLSKSPAELEWKQEGREKQNGSTSSAPGRRAESTRVFQAKIEKNETGAENNLQMYKRLIHKKKGEEDPKYTHWFHL